MTAPDLAYSSSGSDLNPAGLQAAPKPKNGHILVTFVAYAPLDTREECAVTLTGETRKLTVVGNIPELGGWSLKRGITLRQHKNGEKEVVWHSEQVEIPDDRFPFKYRYVANGHRHSPTTRPLIWDRLSRTTAPLEGNTLEQTDELEFTLENSDSGWVTSSGVGTYQLRVGQPPGSKEPLVQLEEGTQLEPFNVQLFEARAGDPKVPRGKPFAKLSTLDLGLPEASKIMLGGDKAALEDDNVTFLMNGQSFEALAFRVDVSAKSSGRLLARGFVSHKTLRGLQGYISSSLISPQMEQIGLFNAAFLVVPALDLEVNNLTDLQRTRWTAAAAAARGTLDIGHRGAGASIGRDGSVRSVRENTMLSFQKAAVNHSDFIEFDVHVTADREVVVHHDFDVKLAVGRETISLGIPALTYAQLSTKDFTHAMVGSSVHGALLEVQQRINQRIMKRNNSSAEDMVRSMLKPVLDRSSIDATRPNIAAWRIADRIATLREAFRQTPKWLGFNIELKYPTEAQLAAMPFRFYSRNYFVDAILKVVLEEAGTRKVIFSTFDPDCATLLSLKQPRFPVFFLTCGGTKTFPDPRMNSLEAAFVFAKTSNLQGVVAEATLLLNRLKEVVKEFHRHGLFLFTYGEVNNKLENYNAQKSYGLDGIILDDVARVAKASGKRCSLFNRPISSPASYDDLTEVMPADIDAMMATSPKSPLLDLGRKSKSNLGTIAEVNA